MFCLLQVKYEIKSNNLLRFSLGRIDEDLVTEPPEIVLDLDTVLLNGCPAEVKKKLKEPNVIVAPLCSSRGPIKLSYVDNMYEKDCVQYIDRMWLVRDGCGNLANATQQIRIRRPEMSVTFPDDVRGKCHLGEVREKKPQYSGQRASSLTMRVNMFFYDNRLFNFKEIFFPGQGNILKF
jgi:hypothetical protein